MTPEQINHLLTVARALPPEDRAVFSTLMGFLSGKAGDLRTKLQELRDSRQLRPDADQHVGRMNVSIDQIKGALDNITTLLASAAGVMETPPAPAP